MIVVCPGCKNQITLDDATMPAGLLKVRCTGCGRTITTQRRDEAILEKEQQQGASPLPKPSATTTDKIKPVMPSSASADVPLSVQSFVNAQIAAARKEILDAIQSLFRGASIHPNGPVDDLSHERRALVCSGDPSTVDALATLLKGMGYYPQSCTTAAESLKNLDTHYDLILIDPSFTDDLEGPKKIIGRLNSKRGIERRRTFVVLLSSTQKSMDGNSAFMSGVNLIVNKADLNNLESFIRQAQKYFQEMYLAFNGASEER